MNSKQCCISLIGSTGSIGTQCLDIVERNPDRLCVVALSAHGSVDVIERQARKYRPKMVALVDESKADLLQKELKDTDIEVLSGDQGVCTCASHPDADIVLGAATGIAGLQSVLSALSAGKILALANKETLVAAGDLAMKTARKHNATMIPVDSEHSAVFQCLENNGVDHVEKILLTASGGPFRETDIADLEKITPQQALKHPNWSMGPKVTIDSATMMNKGLEVIEAYWLFGVDKDQIDIVVHPQSIVHSMVLFTDGSMKAQLSLPDMRLPIQYALTYPDRWPFPEGRVDWKAPQTLHFHPPDVEKFPCLCLARRALDVGGSAPAVLNAANEVAVSLFLKDEIKFMQIPKLIENALDHLTAPSPKTYEEVVQVDQKARNYVFDAAKRNTFFL